MGNLDIKNKGRIKVVDVVVIIAAFLLFVFPNSFRGVKLPLFLFIFLVGLRSILSIPRIVTFSLFASFIITIIYTLLGMGQSKDPSEALNQVIVVYVLTPILWTVTLNYCIERYNIRKIIKFLKWYMVLGALSVFVAVWLLQNGYRSVLETIIDDPNMTFSSGVVEVRLFVYGSLIFFIPAYLQLYDSYKNKWVFFFVVLICILSAIVSGRTALMLSVFIGVFIYAVTHLSIKLLRYILMGGVFMLCLVYILNLYDVDIVRIIQGIYVKVFESPDRVRSEQSTALINGINRHILGAGHGVGVDYIRSAKFPWRYENVPFSLVYRVGLFGFLIYSLPAILTIYFYTVIKNKNYYDNYMLAGAVSICLATFTNPYLESFEFNILYVLPYIYFAKRYAALR